MGERGLFRLAVRQTLPVFFGYLPLGMAFGFMLVQNGHSAFTAAIMGLTMYGGSSQYLAVEMFENGTTLWNMFLMVFFLSVRHMVYGLSLIDKFNDAGKYKPYLIFALTDEAYALYVGTELPEGEGRAKYMLALSALCQSYWVAGCLLGGLLGAVIAVNTAGMGFVLTALFIVLTLDLFQSYKTPLPFALGAAFGVLGVLLKLGNLLMPFAILLILITLLTFREKIEANLEEAVK